VPGGNRNSGASPIATSEKYADICLFRTVGLSVPWYSAGPTMMNAHKQSQVDLCRITTTGDTHEPTAVDTSLSGQSPQSYAADCRLDATVVWWSSPRGGGRLRWYGCMYSI